MLQNTVAWTSISWVSNGQSAIVFEQAFVWPRNVINLSVAPK